jgi:putative zinc finger protein
MTHPGPLLTDYVDGTLGAGARAEVDSHLEGCATCREEVRLARTGKTAGGAVPSPTAPSGLADAAIAEANRIAGGRHPEVASMPGRDRRRPNAPRWAGLATAAAVVVAIALLAPKLGQSSGSVAEIAAGGSASGTSAPEAVSASLPPATAVEVQHVDYSADRLTDAARSLRATLEAPSAAGQAAQAADAGTQFGVATPNALSTDRLGPATRCLQRAFVQPEGRLVRVILATYNGQPAYFGVYLVSPGAGLPSDELRIDVASVHGCGILAQSSAKL